MKNLVLAVIVALLCVTTSTVFASEQYLFWGDANKDKQVNMGDVIALERMILGYSTVNLEADANKDGEINMGDVVKLQRIILGLDALMGDVDSNLKINEDDVTTLQRMVVGLEPINVQADINQDGIISISDVTALEIMIAS